MKRRQRKTVLNINGESPNSPRRRWPNERQTQNGSPNNPLANLLGQYNSDSEAEDDSKPRSHVLNDQVNDFLKEIQSIAPEDSDKNNRNPSMSHPGSFWQECFDEQTGYPYYWHTETNQVTWEMPLELKMIIEKNQRETTASHNSHIPQWSSIPPNKYAQSQSNIPEGMIPKEVVVRNRNRQAGIPIKPAKPPSKSNSSKHPGFKHDDSYDEGKIEMITSFGNDESESEESELEDTPKKVLSSSLKKPPKPSLSKPTTSSQESSKASESSESKVPLGPTLPPAHYGPKNKEKLSGILSQTVQPTKQERKSSGNSISHNEDDILTRLKNQAKLLQQNTRTESEQRTSKDLKLSLVPGYEDDSDGEEESNTASHSRRSSKPLFPISEVIASGEDSDSRDKLAKKIDTGTSKLRIYEYKNSENTVEVKQEDESISNSDNNIGEEKEEEGKSEQETKTNKFLENYDAPSKAFQRKKRIAFDVAPNKSKTSETKDESQSGTLLTEGIEHRGLGFAKDETAERVGSGSPEQDNNAQEAEVANKRVANIAFVKSSTKEDEDGNDNGSISTIKTKEPSEAEKAELKALTEPIMEKLRFLSEGSPATSAVQVMAIQIQTLLNAWESGDLKESYLRNWLVGTGCELTRLEQTAAPPGWECQWDRSHKRYYYRNSSTGDAQWTYPDTDIVGGTEEMELCTTPPPPEHVEAPIIEMSAQAAAMSTSKVEMKTANSTEVNPPQPEDPPPPPPPSISSPEPPPPPRIFAEDLKRSNENRKRKASPDVSDRKGGALYYEAPKDASAKPITEPLPPGVDPPEIAYTLPASALEAGVLYGAQQTNPIYAATLAGAGIPILPHHHTALMQGQLMHYNSAYHQHLHNQALVAARLQGQEAVQFMVAEYARVYENNQVIAKPPMKMPHETSLGSAINSFYSDIASIEKSAADIEKEKAEAMRLSATSATTAIESVTPSTLPTQLPSQDTIELQEAGKEKKKKKLKTGLGKKQKEMSSMVAKWQRAQKNYKEGH